MMKGILLKILIVVLALSPLTMVAGVAFGAPAASGDVIHIVRAGETLFSLGRLYGVSPWAIARVNNLPNPNIYSRRYRINPHHLRSLLNPNICSHRNSSNP